MPVAERTLCDSRSFGFRAQVLGLNNLGFNLGSGFRVQGFGIGLGSRV